MVLKLNIFHRRKAELIGIYNAENFIRCAIDEMCVCVCVCAQLDI